MILWIIFLEASRKSSITIDKINPFINIPYRFYKLVSKEDLICRMTDVKWDFFMP